MKGSSLVLGGLNPDYFSGNMTYYPLISTTYWVIAMEKFVIGTQEVVINKAILDTGTSLIVGDNSFIDNINKFIGEVDSSCNGLDKLPNITIYINGDQYLLTPSDYVMKVTLFGYSQCLSGFMGMAMPDHLKDAVILGDVFLKTYHVHFHMTNENVGIARAR